VEVFHDDSHDLLVVGLDTSWTVAVADDGEAE
jgi:hypothetical protein